MERLQKIIANRGFTSRRKAEELIESGKVFVNGERVVELGRKFPFDVEIVINGIKLEQEEKVYYLLNKPRGVITSVTDDKGRKTVVDLIDTNVRIYPVGRLDYDTTGVLILTNDGVLANQLMHPSSKIDKVYVAKLKGIIKGAEINRLKNGIYIDGFKTSKARVKLRKVDKVNHTSIVEITIHEGHNHQVKKMFEAVGFEVLKLKRERVSFFELKGLKSGEYRRITPKELKRLYVELNLSSK